MKKYIQAILSAVGYYAIKKKWRWHQYITRLQKEDAKRKAEATAWIEAIDHRLLPEVKKTGNVTVSLTSHGKRVGDFAPFAIYSIFHQTVLPNRIVLNINQDKWSNDNLPEFIKKLMMAGLEVNFCEDVGPHTKLLPAMQKYPEDVIITVDDDIYYGKHMIEALLQQNEKYNGAAIICNACKVCTYDEAGHLLPYSKWELCSKDKNSANRLSPFGYRGVLYPAHIFSEEVFNKEVYGRLCPKADDIWFTIIELIEKIPVYCTGEDAAESCDVDRKNEYDGRGSDALHFSNDAMGQNDIQLKQLVEYYKLNGLIGERING